MNQFITFIAAVLFEKGILNKGEAIALAKMAQTETLSDSLQEMIAKVGRALETNQRRREYHPDEINAVDLIKKGR